MAIGFGITYTSPQDMTGHLMNVQSYNRCLKITCHSVSKLQGSALQSLQLKQEHCSNPASLPSLPTTQDPEVLGPAPHRPISYLSLKFSTPHFERRAPLVDNLQTNCFLPALTSFAQHCRTF